MRYLLFGKTECYYASGGANDYLGSGDCLDDLISSEILSSGGGAYGFDIEWWHIFDTETKSIVAGTEWQAHTATNLKVNDGFMVIK